MTAIFAEIDSTISKINTCVHSHRLRDAFVQLRHLASLHGDWHITEEIDRLEEDYKLMLDYTASGANDPGRQKVYESIVNRLLALADLLSYRMHRSQSPEIYYSTLRFEAMQKGDTIKLLLDKYRSVVSELSFATMLSYTDEATNRFSALQSEATELERRLFNRIWAKHPFSAEITDSVKSVFDNEAPYPDHFRRIIVSSLLLGLVQFHDEQKLLLLLDVYQQYQHTMLGISALCAALIDIFLHGDRVATQRVANRIASLRDTSSWSTDAKTVFMQFLKSRDTERVNKVIHDKVIPELMKIKPEMTKHLDPNNFELGSLESNPEWEEIMEKSGIADKLRKAQDMIGDGDVFMATFSTLKSMPFFNEVINWFTPYRASHPALADIQSPLSDICRIIEDSPVFCDSDKYSFVLSLKNLPATHREMISGEIDKLSMAALEMQTADGDMKSTELMANNYVCSIYRFFTLFRRSGDFTNPFAQPLDPLSVPLLHAEFDDTEMLRIVAEFYFKREYYDNAYHIYTALEQRLGADCPTYQKMGYCRQKLGDYTGALTWYHKANMLDNKNLWTLRRMAACFSAVGNNAEALIYLTRIAEQRPDDLNVTLSIGHCYLELGQYAEALKYYFKVEYLDEKNGHALRPIAWCSLLAGNIQQSLRYYDRIMAATPNATDYLNMGHAYLAARDIKMAIDLYTMSLNADRQRFFTDFETDVPTLLKIGIDATLPPLIADSLRYKAD